MKTLFKVILIIVIIGALLGASAYIILYTGEDTETNGEQDTQLPQIDGISGDLTVTAGNTATISVLFSDNVNVTEATLYYKRAGESSWQSKSILSGSATISVPSSATGNYYYYVTVDDAAGNGPVGDPSANGSTYYTITVQPSGNNGGNETLPHTVFLEEATASWCTNCPNVATILHTLYETHDYDFYYVSLIDGANTENNDRLETDYNNYGYPTVYIDGGYDVIVGGNNPQSTYSDALAAAQERSVPPLKLVVSAQYKNTTGEVTVTTTIENRGDESYTGRLKLYLTEIVSHLTGYDSKPYAFGFLEYLVVDDVTIAAQQEATVTETKDISAYDYENLMIIAVVFSSEKNQGYSYPADPDDPHPFDAYYADATNATRVVEGGNLPPQVQITSPRKGTIYRNQNPRFLERIKERKLIFEKLEKVTFIKNKLKNIVYNKTLILGFKEKKITVNASDDSAVANVEFYLDGTLQYTDTEAPYEWTFKRISKGFNNFLLKDHTLKVIVYDDTGKTNSAQLIIKAHI